MTKHFIKKVLRKMKNAVIQKCVEEKCRGPPLDIGNIN